MVVDTVESIMSRKVRAIDVSASLHEVAKIMKKDNISTVIITKDNDPVGIVTERDMAQKVVAEALDVKKVSAEKIMSTPLQTIELGTSIFYAQRLMQQEKFKKLPIVEGTKLVGIVTQTDISNYLTQKRKEFVLKSLDKSAQEAYPV